MQHPAAKHNPTAAEREQIASKLAQLTHAIDELRAKHIDESRLADIELYHHFTGFGMYDRRVIEIVRQMDDPYPYFRGQIAEIVDLRNFRGRRSGQRLEREPHFAGPFDQRGHRRDKAENN